MQLNLNTLEGKLLVIFAACAVMYHLYKYFTQKSWLEEAQERHQKRSESMDPVSSKPIKKKWSPSGWYYDEEKEKWVSPDYLDSSKNTKIYSHQLYSEIEKDKRTRLSKDGPTFAEWKETRMREEQNKQK